MTELVSKWKESGQSQLAFKNNTQQNRYDRIKLIPVESRYHLSNGPVLFRYKKTGAEPKSLMSRKIKPIIMNWYLKVMKQYADFSGRARRTEYWMFALFNFIFFVIAAVIDNVAGLTFGELPYGIFYFLYAFAVLIPGLAVAMRRLHDVGKSGWMILIALIPLVGAIWLLVLMFTDSNFGDNEYGANPKAVVI